VSVIRAHPSPRGAGHLLRAVVAAWMLVFALVAPAGAVTGPTKLFDPVVSPTTATPTTTVSLSVEYRNREGSAPAYVRVIIDGVAHDMTGDGGDDWKQGVAHHFATKLAAGSHQVTFEAADTRKFSDAIDGGTVTVEVPAPPPTPTPQPTPSPVPNPTPAPTPEPSPGSGPAPTPNGDSGGGGSVGPLSGSGGGGNPAPNSTSTRSTGGTRGSGGSVGGSTEGGSGPGGGATNGGPGTAAGSDLVTNSVGYRGRVTKSSNDDDSTDGSTAPPSAPSAGNAAGGGPGPFNSGGPSGGPGGVVGGPNTPAGSGSGAGGGGTSGGTGSGGTSGGLAAALDALGIQSGWTSSLTTLPSLVGTSGAVAMAMAFAIFGKKRRDEEQPAPDEVLEANAARAGMIPASSTLVGVAAVAPGPVDLEAGMPRWRRPSLMQARKADPIRDVVTTPSLRFDISDASTLGYERRLIRYRVVSLLDAPDELRSVEIGQLDQGDEVQLLEKSGAYWLVRTPDGRQGWLHKMTLGDVVAESSASAAEAWNVGDIDGDVLSAYLAARARA
jgi:uncharacterized membrane protein YgcG